MLLRRLALLLALSAIASTSVVGQAPSIVAQSPPAAKTAPRPPDAAPPALPPPTSFNEAFLRAANDILSKAELPAGPPAELVIDPLIDGNTGAQTRATRALESRIMELIRTRYAEKFVVRPFTSENLAKAPLLFIGTFTAINTAGQQTGPRDAFRIWFSLADLKTKKLISKGQARATPAGIDPTPTGAFADSAVWLSDPSIDGYVQTCQGTKVGDPINPIYVDRIKVAPLISDAINAYDERDYVRALELYKQAQAMPGGDQLRVHNGVYLANVKLNRRADATAALGTLVDFGLNTNRLALMFLFQKNTTDFLPNSDMSEEYPQWLKTVAERATAKKACLQLVGHTSHTGPEPFNDRLSAQRAESIRTRLEGQSPQMSKMLQTTGVGWRENIVGTGRDDLSDALDRRVEFRIVDCAL